MKELPILFSTPMVQAIDQNRKTMTRRTSGLEKVNESPNDWIFLNFLAKINGEFKFYPKEGPISTLTECKPRYQVGDKLWVKETHCIDLLGRLVYRAKDGDTDGVGRVFKWISSLFMRKEYARLWLEVTEVKCERLFDISEQDALAEGVESIDHPDFRKYKEYQENIFKLKYASHSFLSLWRKINCKTVTTPNVWVFVYTFKRIDKPTN